MLSSAWCYLGFEDTVDLVKADDRQMRLKYLMTEQILLSKFKLKPIDNPPDDLYNGLKPLKLTRQNGYIKSMKPSSPIAILASARFKKKRKNRMKKI